MFNISEEYLKETWDRHKNGQIDILRNFEMIFPYFCSRIATSLTYEKNNPGAISLCGIETMEKDLTEILVYCTLLAWHWGQDECDILSRIKRYTESLNVHD